MKNPWNDLKGKDCIHPDETEVINAFNNSLKDKASKEKYGIHTEIVPTPYMGNVFTSKIVLLTLNPGFDEKEEKANFYKNYESWFRGELTHGNKLKYPLYCLDENYSCSSPYWKQRLNSLCSEKGVGVDVVAKEVSKIQYFPYNSKKFRPIPLKLIHEKFGLQSSYLPTQAYNFYLVKKAIERNAIVIMTRGKRFWYNAVPDLVKQETNVYSTNSYGNITISPKNLPAGVYDKITKMLLKH
jgi:hypothetical protein